MVILIGMLWSGVAAHAQTPIPDQATLEKLRERLLKTSDAYPHAADIPFVVLTLNERRIIIDAEIHTAIQTAVPLPGRLPTWSPVSVLVNDKPEAALRRDSGYLWVLLPQGVHRVRVEGVLSGVTEWQWTYLLKPRNVTVNAPGWNITGLRADGVPEQQIFFSLQEKAPTEAVGYDQPNLQAAISVSRNLDFGLTWGVYTTVTRLSLPGRAIALRIPLLPGESVLSANAVVKDGFIEVRLGAQEMSYTWESNLALSERLTLATRAEDTWVERWRLVASPVWNVTISGLPPVFEAENEVLVPVWQPWPGEKVELAMSRPQALAGATVTVSRGTHSIAVGKRQRVSKLDLSLRSSLGGEFPIGLPSNTEVTALTVGDKPIPVRKDGTKVIVPVRPGEQSVSIGWKVNAALGLVAKGGEVKLPVESANIHTVLEVPENRWVLWTSGPQRGPAVRFWVVLLCSLLAAVVLGRLTASPLRTGEWMLLVIGLTQVPLPAALTVVGWLFFLAWRGDDSFQRLGARGYNLLQVLLIVLTAIALGILFTAVSEGLLGRPEMFIRGNDSTRTVLRWFQPRSDSLLPTPIVISVSIWWYRFVMLVWALWLAAALLRWLRVAWVSFSRGGIFHSMRKAPSPVTTSPAQPL